jgi:hypothetical protein
MGDNDNSGLDEDNGEDEEEGGQGGESEHGENDAYNNGPGDGGTVDPINLFGDVLDAPEGMNTLFDVDGEGESIGVAATNSTAASSHTMGSGGGIQSGALNRWGDTKKSKAFTQQLQVPMKSPSNASDESGDGYSFGNMMYMMMMQSHMDIGRREQHYKSNSEKREQEYQLCWEKMEIRCDKAFA